MTSYGLNRHSRLASKKRTRICQRKRLSLRIWLGTFKLFKQSSSDLENRRSVARKLRSSTWKPKRAYHIERYESLLHFLHRQDFRDQLNKHSQESRRVLLQKDLELKELHTRMEGLVSVTKDPRLIDPDPMFR